MITVAVITQLVGLALDTWGRIQSRRVARDGLTQGERLRAAQAQTVKNTEIYNEIKTEAQRQIAEHDGTINANLSQMEALFAKLKEEASK